MFTESAVIQEVLEQLYPEIPLLPQPGTQENGRAAGLMRLSGASSPTGSSGSAAAGGGFAGKARGGWGGG